MMSIGGGGPRFASSTGVGDTRIRDLQCKSDDPPSEPMVRVEVREGADWVRIPTTKVELWKSKDGPSDLTRTAKVKFPAEWGGESIANLVNGFKDTEAAQTAYDECRIYFYDEEDGTYQIDHYGYVGSVGPAAETGVFKFWVYDPADLMRGIQVSYTFGEPTIQRVLNFVIRGTDNQGREVGLEDRSIFSDIPTYIAGVQEVRKRKADTSNLGGEEPQEDDFVLKGNLPIIGSYQINVDDLIDDVETYALGSDVTNPVFAGEKRFQINRNNMADVMNWMTGRVGGKWHFEPTETGPVLFFDNTGPSGVGQADGSINRRLFEDEALDASGDVATFNDPTAEFATVDVLNNQALYDIKPFNTLYLYGETSTPSVYRRGSSGAGAPLRSERFPSVKVQYQPLVERAGGYEYAAPVVESDETTLTQARLEAVREFRKQIEDETEGNIETKGEPYINPYDYFRAIPVCDDIYANVNATPITYEVNSVRHVKEAGERYKTELGVSITVDESLLDIEAEYVQP